MEYKVSEELRSRQLVLLDMLKEVDALLTENGIRYSLCAGTLLGAVRHDGFIPWDDDIDIMVDRENYGKIIKLFEGQPADSKFTLNRVLWIYRIQERTNSANDLSVPTIDIFVFDNCPDSAFVRKYKLFLMRMLQGMLKTDPNARKHSFFHRVCLGGTRLLGKLFTYNFKFRWYDKAARIGNKKDSNYLGSYFSPYKNLPLQYSKTLMRDIERHAFEDSMMPIVKEYDNYLSAQYGNYMQLPKEEDRVSTHM